MNLYFIMLLVFIFYAIKIHLKDFNRFYLSKEKTNMIKGIFILIVLYSHFNGYLKEVFANEIVMQTICNKLGQLMVTLFLFYSGYGIYKSIKAKGEKYIKDIPKNRVLKTLLHFDIAVIFMAFIQLLIGKSYPIRTYVLSLIGWVSVGNSNWYIFSIILLYLLTYISFKCFKDKHRYGILLLCVLTGTLAFILSFYREACWYNTLSAYLLGVIYSYYEADIEKLLFNNKRYIFALIGLSILFIIFRKLSYFSSIMYEVQATLFALIIVIITMKIELNSKILKWMGENLFWMYILQRVPMVILTSLGMHESFPGAMLWISFGSTILLTVIFKKFVDKIDNLIFNSR